MAVVALALILAMMMGGALINGGPNQPSDAAGQDGAAGADRTDDSTGSTGPASKVGSMPEALVIPAIGVNGELLTLGVTRKDTVRQPSVPTKAGWFGQSAVPGDPGVSVIVGYIRKSESQPGVFARLSGLKVGHRISVRRSDSTVAVFRVDEIATYPKGRFPTSKVYAATADAELRVITGGGTLGPKDPPGNVVVYASLVGPR